MKRFGTLLFILLLLLLNGCTNANENRQTIYVAAASDLYHALTEIGETYKTKSNSDVHIEFTYGSTGLLTQQIQEGAPFDLFLAAHESYIDRLIEREAVIPESKKHYALGRIVIMHQFDDKPIINAADLLHSDIKSIAIANPEHAPYGKAAKEIMESWGIWEELQPKLVIAENIRQAYQYVESGNADIGFIALALMLDTEYQFDLVPEEDHEPILQALGIPDTATEYELAEQFSHFILSEEGQDILTKYGFDIPR